MWDLGRAAFVKSELWALFPVNWEGCWTLS
jgi:hypothetical protein